MSDLLRKTDEIQVAQKIRESEESDSEYFSETSEGEEIIETKENIGRENSQTKEERKIEDTPERAPEKEEGEKTKSKRRGRPRKGIVGQEDIRKSLTKKLFAQEIEGGKKRSRDSPGKEEGLRKDKKQKEQNQESEMNEDRGSPQKVSEEMMKKIIDDMNRSIGNRTKGKERVTDETRRKEDIMDIQENHELIQKESIELIEIEGKTDRELLAMIVQEINMSRIERKSLEMRLSLKDKETEDLKRRVQEMEDREIKEIETRRKERMETEERTELLERRVGKIEEKMEFKIHEEIANVLNEKKENLQQELEEEIKEAIREAVDGAQGVPRDEGERRRQEEEIRELRRQAEMRMRRERRNNIVINGLSKEEGKDSKTIENWLYNQLKIRVNVLRCWTMQGKKKNVVIVGAELGSWNQKREVMMKKSNLKEKETVKKVYIDNDMTWEERRIKKAVIQKAMDTKRNKPDARVKWGHNWLEIDGMKLIYDEKKKEPGFTRVKGNGDGRGDREEKRKGGGTSKKE